MRRLVGRADMARDSEPAVVPAPRPEKILATTQVRVQRGSTPGQPRMGAAPVCGAGSRPPKRPRPEQAPEKARTPEGAGALIPPVTAVQVGPPVTATVGGRGPRRVGPLVAVGGAASPTVPLRRGRGAPVTTRLATVATAVPVQGPSTPRVEAREDGAPMERVGAMPTEAGSGPVAGEGPPRCATVVIAAEARAGAVVEMPRGRARTAAGKTRDQEGLRKEQRRLHDCLRPPAE